MQVPLDWKGVGILMVHELVRVASSLPLEARLKLAAELVAAVSIIYQTCGASACRNVSRRRRRFSFRPPPGLN